MNDDRLFGEPDEADFADRPLPPRVSRTSRLAILAAVLAVVAMVAAGIVIGGGSGERDVGGGDGRGGQQEAHLVV